MKKILLSVCFLALMGTAVAQAQELTPGRRSAVFSPALLSNPSGSVPGTVRQQNVPQRKVAVKKIRGTLLRFDEGDTTLSEENKEKLMKIANRILEKKSYTITVVSASRQDGDARKRAIAVEGFLRNYARDFIYIVRYINPGNIVDSVDNTVRITEKK